MTDVMKTHKLCKDSAKNLFQFLRELSNLKTKKILDVNNFEKVLWLDQTPKEKEIYSITHRLSLDPSNVNNYDKWIEIKKPKIPECPKLPHAIKNWIVTSALENYKKKPQLLDYILQENLGENAEVFQAKVLLKDMPKIQNEFLKFYEEQWQPWADEKKRLEPVWQRYNDLYEIYHKNKNQGENYQVVLGLGLLSTKTKKGRFVKRHIVTTPLSMHFNGATGTITVGPGDQNVEMSLELDMLEMNERPNTSDKIKSDLNSLNNDFWIDGEFIDCLKSWVNSYDPQSQFYPEFDLCHADEPFTTLSISPAIILRKRGERTFSQFYKNVIEDLESTDQVNPCLNYIIDEDQDIKDINADSLLQELNTKYYFPLPVNQEQESIITKLSNSVGVLVQGPPGTGKTHSIANLICHLLATGKKVLITSQTDRALKVLKNKLPDDLKPLCVEVLGRDQKSLSELKNSVNSINSNYQEWNREEYNKEIEHFEKRDNELKGEKVHLERKLDNIRQFETRVYEKLFRFYSGSAGSIAKQVREEQDLYAWIKNDFNIKDSSVHSPISNNEATTLFRLLKELKSIPDLSIFEEELPDENSFLKLVEIKEKIQNEREAEAIIEESLINKEIIDNSAYHSFSNQDCDSFFNLLSELISTAEHLINPNQQEWVRQAVMDCLLDKDRLWRYLFDTTHEILKAHKDVFLSIDKLKVEYPISLRFTKLKAVLDDFFNKFTVEDNPSWGWFCSKEVRNVKKITKMVTIDGRKCRSYREAEKLYDYAKAKIAKYDLLKNWRDKEQIKDDNFGSIYHLCKDFCEPLEECLQVHKCVSNMKDILNKYLIPHPKWDLNSLKKELEVIKVINAKKIQKRISSEFEKDISILKPYSTQKNQIANQLIKAYRSRHIEMFSEAHTNISNFNKNKKIFQEILPIKTKTDAFSDTFFEVLRKDTDVLDWQERLSKFEEAWAWNQVSYWIKENGDETFFKSLTEERENLIDEIQKNLETLVAKKSWYHCLSNITDEQQASLKGWAYAVSKIGKGTGKTASKHRRVARERMSECKEAIPAWIMPLYRVVENIKPGSKPFDIAIIDEASQTGPEGLMLNYLASKVIVVGDNEQISPEMLGILDADVESLKKKYLSNVKFFDYIGREYSYYDYCDISFKSRIQLREHFRCMPEIIEFSNKLSYSGRPLVPMRQYGSTRLEPLKHTFIERAISKVGSAKYPQNECEAESLVKQLKDCIVDPQYDGKSFGIISLQGSLQIKLIEKLLTDHLDKETIEKREIVVGGAYDFQGDERDVIFLSMAVSNDYNFNALTKDTYKKRYNVAASRGKDQLWLCHSVKVEDLSVHDFRRQLLIHCMDYKSKTTGWSQEELQNLYKRIQNTKNKTPQNAPSPFESWFEAKVFWEIAMKGFLVIPQLSVSNYRIDMVVIGSNGRLAVECDGDIYHSEAHEESDFNRQWKLERYGWTFRRIRSSAFYLDPSGVLEGLWEKLKEMKIYPQA